MKKIWIYTAAVVVTCKLERLPRMQKVGCANPGYNRRKSLKQIFTAPLKKARQQVRVSFILSDDYF